MASAQVAWQKVNTKEVKLRLNRNQDPDIIAYLASTGAAQQTIRRLIREEIARTNWQPAPSRPAGPALSLDGGETFLAPDDLEDCPGISTRWDAITAAMEPELYAAIDEDYSPCPLSEFVRHYLEAAGKDLVVD